MIKCAAQPCKTCPYRQDVPSGVWHSTEYEKLIEYDQPTFAQPPALFMCHSSGEDLGLCRGWVDVHGEELLALRLAISSGRVDPSCLDGPAVPVFESGADAANHGMADLEDPSEEAVEAIHKVSKIRRRRR